MIEGRDIVCFSFGAWDDMVETPQYLMTRLAKHNRVLYIDAPVSPLGALRGLQGPNGTWRAIKNWREGYRQVADNIWVAAPPPILPKRTNRFVNRINAAWLRRWLGAQGRSLGFDRPIFWTFQPRFPSIGRALNPSVSLYYCVDDFAAAPYDWNNEAEVRALEEQTLPRVGRRHLYRPSPRRKPPVVQSGYPLRPGGRRRRPLRARHG